MSDSKINQALALMKKSGFKFTERRKAMLTFLESEDKYISAKEVYDFMNEHYEGISFDTIYRNLSDFTELNILEETEFDGEKKFRFHCAHGGSHHHHHFICTECGATQVLEMCPMDYFEEQLNGAEIEEHRFEIFGKCADCVAKRSEKDNRFSNKS